MGVGDELTPHTPTVKERRSLYLYVGQVEALPTPRSSAGRPSLHLHVSPAQLQTSVYSTYSVSELDSVRFELLTSSVFDVDS